MSADHQIPAPADPDLLVLARDGAADKLAYARRHFDLAVEAAEASGPWTGKGPTHALGIERMLSGIDKPPVDPMRWRHHGSDAHLHVTHTDMTATGGPNLIGLELYSRSTGRPSPICVVFERPRLEGLDTPDAILREARDILRETDDAMAPREHVAMVLDTWTCAVAGHLRSRGASQIAGLDFPDDGRPPRILSTDPSRMPIEHPDMAAIAPVLPRGRLVGSIGMDLVVNQVRRTLSDETAPGDPLAVLRATAAIAEAVERRNAGRS